MNTTEQIIPEVGMGCTYSVGSDRHAATIIDMTASKKTITIQDDNCTRTDHNGGLSESQEYTYAADPNGRINKATLRKNGRYMIGKYSYVGLGHRSEYSDPSF